MRGIVKYQYVNQNPKGGNLAAQWHPVKATAELGAKLSGVARARGNRNNRPRGQRRFNKSYQRWER